MRVRFVSERDIGSDMIQLREGEMSPFTPSHVEIVLPEGYLGARDDSEGGQPLGVRIRPVGYDKATMAHELIFDVPLPNEAAALQFARSKIGAPYDWQAILDYVLPENWHEAGHVICSAFVTLVFKKGGLFRFPLATAPHATDPRDVLLVLSALMAIPN